MAKTAKESVLSESSDSQVVLGPEQEDDVSFLRPKLRVFADAVLSGKSQTQSAIEAGYVAASAGVTACKLLKRQDVRDYIAAKKQSISVATDYEVTKWRQELINIAHSNVDDFTKLNKDGDLEVDFSKATRTQLGAIQGVKVKKRKVFDNKGNVVGEEHHSEFKLWDKLRAAELLGKHSGFLAEPEQRVVIDVADRLLRARQRVLGLPSSSGNVDAEE